MIDDHAMFRTGLRMVLNTGLKDIEVIEAGTLNEGINSTTNKPDVILLDIKLPGLNGLEGINLLKRKWPLTPILVLSSQDEPETARQALERGATRFISKANTADEIVNAILLVLQGNTAPHIRQASVRQNVANSGMQTHLTRRQLEVLDLLCQGMSNKIIGRQLSLSENTVRSHVQAILTFLQVSSRGEASFAARRSGLVG
ncbi:MAG: response regulator transcription factor [Methylococcales bacterium]